MTLLDLLSRNPIFSHRYEVEKDKLVEMAITRTYPQGDWIT
jgi:hypothetical protein